MTEKQADQIIDFICGMLRPPDPVETRRSWRLQLAHLDPELASKAAINGMQVWEFFPSWPVFYGEYRSLKRSAQPAYTGCQTCGGDKFVLVLLRRPETSQWMARHGISAVTDQMIEEMAPCPSCNPNADTSFRRHDGSEVTSMDPARISEILANTRTY